MQNYRRFVVLIVLSLSIAVAACSATATRRSLGETLDDAVITNKLKTRFMKDKTVKAFQIDVDTWKGVVSLRGEVESQDQVYRAIELAEQQAGVKEVKSYLVLRDASAPAKPASRKSRVVVEEEDIGEKESQKKADDHQVEPVEPAQPAQPAETGPDAPIEEGIPQVTPD